MTNNNFVVTAEVAARCLSDIFQDSAVHSVTMLDGQTYTREDMRRIAGAR